MPAGKRGKMTLGLYVCKTRRVGGMHTKEKAVVAPRDHSPCHNTLRKAPTRRELAARGKKKQDQGKGRTSLNMTGGAYHHGASGTGEKKGDRGGREKKTRSLLLWKGHLGGRGPCIMISGRGRATSAGL